MANRITRQTHADDVWQGFRLNEICIEDRRIIGQNESTTSSLRYLSLEDIESETGRILANSTDCVNQGKSTTFAFDERHVLYGKLRPYLNKVALPDFPGRCTTELIPLLPNSELVRRKYLAFLLRRKETVLSAMRGKTGSRMPRADMGQLLKTTVKIPPPSIQDHIIANLEEQFAEVGCARKAVEEQLQAAEALLPGILNSAFSTAPAKSWDWIRLNALAETCSGTTPSRGQKDFYGGDIPWVKTGELKDGLIHSSEEKVTREALAHTSLRLLPKGTLLIAMYGQGQTRGRTGILDCEATTNQACFAILPNHRFLPLFLQFWFRHSYARLRQLTEGRGGSQPNFNGNMLKSEVVPLPTLEEQQSICDRLTMALREHQNLCAALLEKQAAISKLPAALLREAFTGAT
jgi:type I restriction enzyme S subunit